ncbi:hypothetical protein H1235_07960 [Pseudoxanthomonas sp. NC8]|nr:hypothetical protein H1235_07960 [Pseudoxanthomonas sp. NC8]
MIRIDTDPNRIDWFRVLADLQRAGVPMQSLSRLLHIPYSTIAGWRQGSEPKFIDGERLLQAWVGSPAENWSELRASARP